MSKMSKAIAVLGVVAGLGVAALPLSSYAASSQSKQAKIQVEVGGSISLEIDQATDDTNDWADNTLDLGQVMVGGAVKEGTLTAKVTSNEKVGYKLTMYATNEGKMTGLLGNTIANEAPAQGSEGWGYKTETVTEWTKMPLAATPATINTANAGEAALDASTDVTFGVSVDAGTEEDTYTGTVIFTASVQ